MVALVSQASGTACIERLEQLPVEAGREKIQNFILEMGEGGKNARFIPSVASVYPLGRFFARYSVDTPVKLKEPGYLEEQVKAVGIDIASSSVSILNAADGLPFDPARNLSAQKELLFCGAPTAEIRAAQEDLLTHGIYPEHMQLGSLSCIGALMDYVRHSGNRKPILHIELGQASSSIFIVNADRLDLCRTIPHGLDSMLPVLAAELGVKDPESAARLLYSNTFDFTEMGPVLLGRLLREMRASTGFYEVQTGQSIGSVFVHLIPPSLDWTRQCIARSLGVELQVFDFAGWLGAKGVQKAAGLDLGAIGEGWMGVLGMLPELTGAKN